VYKRQTLRYFNRQIELTWVNLHLNTRVDAAFLLENKFDEVILATGVTPRKTGMAGEDHPKVLSYVDVLYHKKEVGKKVAIIGAGGIGFDVAEYLSHDHDAPAPSLDIKAFMQEWGVDMNYAIGGALTAAKPAPPAREIYLLKRSTGKHGKDLGKTTGWIHRASLKMKEIKMISSVVYNRVDDAGLHITVGDTDRVLDVDHVVVCAGQEPLRELLEPLQAAGANVHLIGGADKAVQLDAKRAIDQGARLAAAL